MIVPSFLQTCRPHASPGIQTWVALEVLYVIGASLRQGDTFLGALITGVFWTLFAGIQLLPALGVLRARSASPTARFLVGLMVLGWALLMLLGGLGTGHAAPESGPRERNFDLRWLEFLLLVGGLVRLPLALLVALPAPGPRRAARAGR